jgi:hypothetical protein
MEERKRLKEEEDEGVYKKQKGGKFFFISPKFTLQLQSPKKKFSKR